MRELTALEVAMLTCSDVYVRVEVCVRVGGVAECLCCRMCVVSISYAAIHADACRGGLGKTHTEGESTWMRMKGVNDVCHQSQG